MEGGGGGGGGLNICTVRQYYRVISGSLLCVPFSFSVFCGVFVNGISVRLALEWIRGPFGREANVKG